MDREELLQVIEQAKRDGVTSLDLSRKGIKELPVEIGGLIELERLNLSENQLSSLPPDIGRLTNLTWLELNNNNISSLPPEIGHLTNLTWLIVDENNLSSLPPEIGCLIKLEQLGLDFNQLTSLPPEIGCLINLTRLYLQGNQLSSLPFELGRLIKLKHLDLDFNNLDSIPSEIGNLANLNTLYLVDNNLSSLPVEFSLLPNLIDFFIAGNPFNSPPPEIVDEGNEAILAYLRERLDDCSQQWVSKLVVVGEGGVGKTSLLRALRGEGFSESESTTHGIDIRPLPVAHLEKQDVTMQLTAWDFGGQDIYHATHQFFLTNRSLFVLAWNARHGFEQGKLFYWLDTIEALAPDSPILIVATHTDERDADLPLAELQKKYPRVLGQVAISSRTGAGIEDLRTAIAHAAASLPLMGEMWPTKWLHAAEAVRARTEKHTTPHELDRILAEHGVTGTSARVLVRWLHELGELLYYRENDELSDTVILKPQWVTEYISKVLESEEVIARSGLFTRQHMLQLWADLPPQMQNHFLHLMERFDLSYETKDNREVSLVVERLPLDAPDFAPLWDKPLTEPSCKTVALRFRLNTVPAGIPTWFIARAHRFTTKTHWRTGGVFAHDESRQHLGLVRAFPHDRFLELTVRGPHPHNFFALLYDNIEVTLRRFPGLHIRRMVPCPGHNGKPCDFEFDLANLEKATERQPPIPELQCQNSFEMVPVSSLLFGLHWSSENAVLDAIADLKASEAEKHAATQNHIANLTQLMQREFLDIYRREQAVIDSHCPNVFVLRPRGRSGMLGSIKQILAGQQIELQLYCQAPGHWHPAMEGGCYTIDDPAKWLRATAPYLQKLVKYLRLASPLLVATTGLRFPTEAEAFDAEIKWMEELVKLLPDLKASDDTELADELDLARKAARVEGAELRVLRQLLDKKDPDQKWGGLRKILTPEHHYLWLCEHHLQEYK